MATPSDVGARRCAAAGSIRSALNRAITLVKMEFFSELHRQPEELFAKFSRGDCASLRAEFDERKLRLLDGLNDRTSRVLTQVLKSCYRFFDAPCEPCDSVAVEKARLKWVLDVSRSPTFCPSSPASWSDSPLGELARRVRLIVGTKWGERLGEYRESVLVPDQNGCLENPKLTGGTLGTAPHEYSSDVYGLRVGTAKTKGKIRVVTMQSARVKEILRPVHECLYDFLASRKWLIKGDFLSEHAQLVVDDAEEGESYVSGDYEAATNNIYLPAVKAIIDVLLESPDLLPEEKEIISGSFDPETLHWTSRTGRKHPIRRGSMMGNLLSFPVLCLLNKACFDIVSTLRRKRTGVKRYRRPIINGDDIAFSGDIETFNDWVLVTSHFGLKVNQEKTGFSSEYIELNSRSYCVEKKRLLRKPVLSCLQPRNEDTSCLLTRLWEGLKTCKAGTLRWAVVELRHEIIRRGVTLSSLPRRYRVILLKERWFRIAVVAEPKILETGVERAWPVVLKDFGPPTSLFKFYDSCCQRLLAFGVRLARGHKLPAYEKVLERGRIIQPPHPAGRLAYASRWVWRWPLPLLRWWEERELRVEFLTGKWRDDHPHLATTTTVLFQLPGFAPPFSLLVDALRPDGVNWI